MPLKRRSAILLAVEKIGHVSVSQLSKEFRASDDTIRRDLDALAAEGRLQRAHGGAVSLSFRREEYRPISDRTRVNVSAKNRIAQCVAGLISDSESLFINSGTTTLAIAHQLTSRPRLTVLTNNLLIPSVVDDGVSWDLYVLGGRYHFGSQATTRTEGFGQVSSVTTDTAIIGVGGVTGVGGFTVSLFEDAAVIQPMIAKSGRVIIAADSSKFGQDNLVSISLQGRPTSLVTDERPSEDIQDWLHRNDIELIIAK